MDDRKFDSLARSAAAWTSRRKLLGSILGAFAAGLIGHQEHASAQTATPPCTPAANKEDLSAVASYARRLLGLLPSEINCELNSITDHKFQWNSRFCYFAGHLRGILERGAAAEDAGWNGREVAAFQSELINVLPTVAFGYSAGQFTDDQKATPHGLRAQNDANSSTASQCGLPNCFTNCLNAALDCYESCNNDQGCIKDDRQCIDTYLKCFFDTPQSQDKSCYDEYIRLCEEDPGHCCGGMCIP